MDTFEEIMFIDGIIPDKISTSNDTWALLMGNHLHIFQKGIKKNNYLLPQTYHSPVYFINDELIRCHNVEINLNHESLQPLDLLSVCKDERLGVRLTGNHVITNVAWSNNTALVGVDFFIPRNDGFDKNDKMNYLLAITGKNDNATCKKLGQHPYLSFNTTQASKKYWASYYGGLHIWDNGVEVNHGLHFDVNLSMENIFINEDEDQIVLVNALGKLFVINTTDWKIRFEFHLQKSEMMLLTSISPNGQLIATGNNEGDLHLYQQLSNGFETIVSKNLEGIITSINASNNQLLIGLNSNTKKGLRCYALKVPLKF